MRDRFNPVTEAEVRNAGVATRAVEDRVAEQDLDDGNEIFISVVQGLGRDIERRDWNAQVSQTPENPYGRGLLLYALHEVQFGQAQIDNLRKLFRSFKHQQQRANTMTRIAEAKHRHDHFLALAIEIDRHRRDIESSVVEITPEEQSEEKKQSQRYGDENDPDRIAEQTTESNPEPQAGFTPSAEEGAIIHLTFAVLAQPPKGDVQELYGTHGYTEESLLEASMRNTVSNKESNISVMRQFLLTILQNFNGRQNRGRTGTSQGLSDGEIENLNTRSNERIAMFKRTLQVYLDKIVRQLAPDVRAIFLPQINVLAQEQQADEADAPEIQAMSVAIQPPPTNDEVAAKALPDEVATTVQVNIPRALPSPQQMQPAGTQPDTTSPAPSTPATKKITLRLKAASHTLDPDLDTTLKVYKGFHYRFTPTSTIDSRRLIHANIRAYIKTRAHPSPNIPKRPRSGMYEAFADRASNLVAHGYWRAEGSQRPGSDADWFMQGRYWVGKDGEVVRDDGGVVGDVREAQIGEISEEDADVVLEARRRGIGAFEALGGVAAAAGASVGSTNAAPGKKARMSMPKVLKITTAGTGSAGTAASTTTARPLTAPKKRKRKTDDSDEDYVD